MNTILSAKDVLVLRTDFTNENAWESICTKISTPDPEFGFIPFVEFYSNRNFDGLSSDNLISTIPANYGHSFIFIVDHLTISHAEHPVLCIDLKGKPGRYFRVIPSEMWGVENNLSIANMDFETFQNNAQSDGIFRGFL